MNASSRLVNGTTIYEYDLLFPEGSGTGGDRAEVPKAVFAWLEALCLRTAEEGNAAWLRLTQRSGRKAVQVKNHVGVVCAPGGFQIEVLPKIGRALNAGPAEARQLLIDMLCCLPGFRHILAGRAHLAAAHMPLMEVFIREFLLIVENIVKRGLRGDYNLNKNNMTTIRGKLVLPEQLRRNLARLDCFYTEHDEFSTNRPENRLIHAALQRALSISRTQANQRLARSLGFVFADVPPAVQIAQEFQRVRLDRSMGYYANALAWARLLLNDTSPLTGIGRQWSPTLLYPMEVVFEGYVAKHLSRQLQGGFKLKTQASSRYLVRHKGENWFQLKPDLLVQDICGPVLVLDTKWKLLDSRKYNTSEKYGLSQIDLYQIYSYGKNYLSGPGDVVLIYPRTDTLSDPLPVFDFLPEADVRLWISPFCLKSKILRIPKVEPFISLFIQ